MSNVTFSASFKRMLNAIYREHDCRICEAVMHYSAQGTTNEVNYLTMRGNMMSFLPAGKEHKTNDDGRWSRDGRQDGKVARVIRKIIPPEVIGHLGILDTHFEKFGNYVASYVGQHGDGDGGSDPVYRLAVCNGELIPLYYNYDAYSPDAGGNLTSSCMRHSDDYYFDIYKYNPNVVSMIVCLDAEHKVHGRALVWKTIGHGLCMDTVYSSDSIRPMFITFAKENGMRYKSSHSCHWDSFDMLNGIVDGKDARVSAVLNIYDTDYYPYLDTMMHLCMDTGTISNRDYGLNEYRTLRCTDGGFEEHGQRVECIVSGDMIDEENAIYVDYRNTNGRYVCGHAHEENVHDTREGYRLEDDCTYIRSRREYYCLSSEDIVYIGDSDEYIHIDNSVVLRDGSTIRYNDAVELSNGDYVREEDAVELWDGSWEELSDTVLLWDSTYALKTDSIRCDETGSWWMIGTFSDVATTDIQTA